MGVSRRRFLFDGPDRFVPGTVGEPGQRTFYLQARKGSVIATVGVEKVQVAALASRLDQLLDAVGAAAGSEARPDHAPLEEPVVELFRVGAMALAWDPESESVVIEARELTEADAEAEGDEEVEPDPDDRDAPDTLQVRLTAEEARSFIRRAAAVVAAGRPGCPFCGQPLNPEGHFCPRGNGQVH